MEDFAGAWVGWGCNIGVYIWVCFLGCAEGGVMKDTNSEVEGNIYQTVLRVMTYDHLKTPFTKWWNKVVGSGHANVMLLKLDLS
jgi:hypothetical protein